MTHNALSVTRPDPVRYLEVLRDNTARTHWLRLALRGTVTLVVVGFSWLTGVAIANGKILVIAIDRNLDRLIDRWLRWQDEREARRRERWKRNMHRDQWLGIW